MMTFKEENNISRQRIYEIKTKIIYYLTNF